MKLEEVPVKEEIDPIRGLESPKYWKRYVPATGAGRSEWGYGLYNKNLQGVPGSIVLDDASVNDRNCDL